MRLISCCATAIIVAVASAGVPGAVSAATGDSIIEGFAQYQADRVQRLILDQFVYDLAGLRLVKRLLPATASAVGFHGPSAKRLVPLIQFGFDQDLDVLKKIAVCMRPPRRAGGLKADIALSADYMRQADLVRKFLRKSDEDLENERKDKGYTAIDQLQALSDATCDQKKAPKSEKVKVKVGGPLEDWAIKATTKANLKAVVRELNKKISSGKATLRSLTPDEQLAISNPDAVVPDEHATFSPAALDASPVDASQAVLNGDGHGATESTGESMPPAAAPAPSPSPQKQELPHELKKAVAVLEKKISEADQAEAKLLKDGVSTEKLWTALRGLNTLARVSDKNGGTADDLKGIPTAVVVKQLFDILEAIGAGHDNYFELAKFEDVGLFLAALSDAQRQDGANAADKVQKVIDDFVDEQRVFAQKRGYGGIVNVQPLERGGTVSCVWHWYSWWVNCENSWFLGSYFGVTGASQAIDDASDKHFAARAYGPVALEYKLGTLYGWPVTIAWAPVDVGTYVTNELTGKDYSAKFKDIETPSYFVSFGVRNRPISILLGHQSDVKTADGRQISFNFLGVAFDLPLYTIW